MISIDFGSYETKVTDGKAVRGNISINKAFSFDTPISSYENGYIKNEISLLEIIRDKLKDNKIKFGDCSVNIKSTTIITREIIFPLLSDKDIEGLLQYQLPEYLPMDMSKYVIQHKPLEKIIVDGNEKLNTLVAAIPKDIVDNHFHFLKELGLRPVIMDFQCNSIWKLFKHSNIINNRFSTSDKTIAIVDLGYRSTSTTIIKNDIMQFCRVFDAGGVNISDSLKELLSMSFGEISSNLNSIEDISIIEEGYTDYNRFVNIVRTGLDGIMERIDRIFRYFLAQEVGNEIQKIFLVGGLSNIKGIQNLFANYFNLPVFTIKNIDKVNMQEDLNKYFNCISALLRDDEVQKNERFKLFFWL